jgi:glycosyltransferase involved in cell wall biosynthesis
VARVHQWIPCFTPGDAMGQAAVAWRRALRGLGLGGELYADEVAPGYEALVQPLEAFRPRPDDVVLYHHGIASPLAGRLLHAPCRRAVVFHNITPPRAYQGTQLEEALWSGRAQLAALADGVELSIGVSRYNAAELTEAGHRHVSVVPLYVEPRRFRAEAAEPTLLAKLRSRGSPRVVSVSRVVPHKRVEDLLSLHGELLRRAPDAQLLIVGGFAAGHAAFKALKARADELGQVTFLGRVSHGELVAAYRAGDVYVSMSEHEGFGVPLVEAMAAELPVLAFGAAAVPETLGGAGLVFDEKRFDALAELVLLVSRDGELRGRLVEGQRRRLADFSLAATTQALGAALAPLVPPRRPSPVPAPRRPKVTVVVQRYGSHIIGGAEAHARMVAERLTPWADVEVLTSCARDHLTWENVDTPGETLEDGVTVHRLPVRRPRRMRDFNQLSRRVFGRPSDLVTEEHWLEAQGPQLDGLDEALAKRRATTDAFLFFTALYAPTVHGLPLVAERALVVPTAHDEPPMAFDVYDDVFHRAAALLFNTPEEEAFIRRRFPATGRSRVVGVGIEAPPTDGDRFREAFGLTGPYLLYVGRLEEGKGVADLVRLHQRVVRRYHDAPSLVLAGAGSLSARGHKLVKVGRLDEQAKWDAMAGALAVVVPSRFESLSLVTLEAFAVGTPVLGNRASDVVSGQLSRSLAGATFGLDDAESFVAALTVIGESRAALSQRALAFAARHGWAAVMNAYHEEIDLLARSRR